MAAVADTPARTLSDVSDLSEPSAAPLRPLSPALQQRRGAYELARPAATTRVSVGLGDAATHSPPCKRYQHSTQATAASESPAPLSRATPNADGSLPRARTPRVAEAAAAEHVSPHLARSSHLTPTLTAGHAQRSHAVNGARDDTERGVPSWRSKSVEQYHHSLARPSPAEHKHKKSVAFSDSSASAAGLERHVYENVDECRRRGGAASPHRQQRSTSAMPSARSPPQLRVVAMTPSRARSVNDECCEEDDSAADAAISSVSYRFYDSNGREQQSLSQRVSAQLLQRSAMRLSMPRRARLPPAKQQLYSVSRRQACSAHLSRRNHFRDNSPCKRSQHLATTTTIGYSCTRLLARSCSRPTNATAIAHTRCRRSRVRSRPTTMHKT